MAAEVLSKELIDANELLASQERAGLNKDDVLESMFRSWLARLSSPGQKFTDKGKAILTDAIRQGPWNENQTKELARIVLTNGTKQNPKSMGRRANQKLLHIQNMVPTEVMLKLKGKQFSLASKASILAGVATGLGLQCPDNPTLFHMVAFLAFCEDNWDMSQAETFKVMDMLQRFIKATPPNSKLSYLEVYPPTAALLPDDLKASAFKDGSLPPEQQIPELNTILGTNKMRGRVSGKQPEWFKHVPDDQKKEVARCLAHGGAPASSASSASVQSSSPPTDKATAMQQQPPLPTADLFRFRAAMAPADPVEQHVCAKCKAELPSEQAEIPLPPAAGPHDGSPQEALDALDEMEKELIAASAHREGAKKKPSAANAKKRPAAAAAAACGKLVLGCSRCRYGPSGCATCRSPDFGGKRGKA